VFKIKAVVSCAIIACNFCMQYAAIIAGFPTCWKIFMRQKCAANDSVSWNHVISSVVEFVLDYITPVIQHRSPMTTGSQILLDSIW